MPSLWRVLPAVFVLFLLASASVARSQNPTISGSIVGGTTTTIHGTGNPMGKISVCVSPTDLPAPPTTCTAPAKTAILLIGGANQTSAPVNADQEYSVTLSKAPAAGSFVYVIQTVAGGVSVASPCVEAAALSLSTHEREHTDFVGGTLLSANGSNYSQGSVFLALNYDRELYRPGYYSGPRTKHPGLNFFFQARLTTIPVNASQSVSTTSVAVSAPATTPTAPTVASFLAAQKAAQFGGGGYIPFLFASSPSSKALSDRTSAFYMAPIAKFGFSTPSGSPGGSSSTSSGTTSVTTTTTVLGTATPDNGQLYNFWLAGFRIATADLDSGSIHTRHYFDIGIGKYSNLQSLICRPEKHPTNPACLTATVNSTATPPSTTYAVPVDPATESRATLLRLTFEGYLEIPSVNTSSFILGMSANTGPSLLSRRAYLDTNNRAVEDIEFLIAYKFDVTKLFAAVPLIGQ